MAPNLKKIARQIGEHLVVAELGRRGVLATLFTGNISDADVLAYANGRSIPIQVKSWAKGRLSVGNAKKYLDIRFDKRQNIQTIIGKEDIDRDLIFVLVKRGKALGEDEFYIYSQGVVQDLIFKEHSAFLKKHKGVRPKTPKSMHSAYSIKDLIQYKDNWNLIAKQFKIEFPLK